MTTLPLATTARQSFFIARFQPLVFLSAVEFFVSFSFFGLHNILVLFLIKNKGFADILAYSLWKDFATLSFISALLGGFVGGRYLPFKLAALVGLNFMLGGYLLLCGSDHSSLPTLRVGLAFIACGSGLFGPNARNLLGTLYQKQTSRYQGFTCYHFADMLGQTIGPILLTYLSLHSSIGIFSAASFSIVAGVIIFLIIYFKTQSPLSNNVSALYLPPTNFTALKGWTIVFISAGIVLGAMYTQTTGSLLVVWAVGVGGAFLFILIQSSYRTRIRFITLLLLLGGLFVAEVCFREAVSVLTVFTDRQVNCVIGHTAVPAGMFISFEPLFVMLLVPFFVWMWKKLESHGMRVTAGTSFSVGLGFIGLAYGSLVVGILATHAGVPISVGWLLLCYGLMAMGELLILPIGIAAVTQYAPKRWMGFWMGCWLLSISFSSYLCGLTGQWISPASGMTTLATYRNLFIVLACLALTSGLILFLVWKYWWKKHCLVLTEGD